jgi:membrane protein DedA with SNARE-associated domain
MDFFQPLIDAFQTGQLPDIGNWSYLLILILVFFEGPSITLVAGAMAATGALRWEWVFLSAMLGNFLADSTWYALGYFGGYRFLRRHLRWFRENDAQVAQMEAHMHENGVKLFAVSKLSLGVAIIPTLVAAGMARLPWRRLLPVSLVVEPIWTGALTLLGYRLGDSIARMERGLQILAVVGGVLVVVLAIWLYRRMFKKLAHLDSNSSAS